MLPSFRLLRFYDRTLICISTCSPSALPLPPVCFDSVPVEQQPKKAEEPEHLQHILLLLPQLQCGPASHQHQHQLPASTCWGERIASQGGLLLHQTHAICLFIYLRGPLFCFFFLFSFLTLFFVPVCLSLLCCSVTRSRSSLSLVYVLPFFLFLCMQAEWAGAGTSCLCGLQCSSESFCSATVLRFIFSRT